MAHAGQRPNSRSTPSPRIRTLRRHPSAQIARNHPISKRAPSRQAPLSSDIEQSRPVLVLLHPNLRRLPSRILLAQKAHQKDMRTAPVHEQSLGSLRTGAKRKRVFSANENVVSNGRPTGNLECAKRLRSSYSSSDERNDVEQAEMDVDASTISDSGSDDSEREDASARGRDDEISEENSTDEHLINFADQKQLYRLRKIDLIGLYHLAGLPEDPEALTKPEIVSAIIDARDDYVSVPPSSPVGNLSDYSSDDGNIAGDEATDAGGLDVLDAPARNLRRRATIHELGKSSSVTYKGRSFSMGNLLTQPKAKHLRVNSNGSTELRSKTSNVSSPTTSVESSVWPVHSPPATRLRSRQLTSAMGTKTNSRTKSTSDQASMNKTSKGKGKAKQVEFKSNAEDLAAGESDLTELEELEKSLVVGSSKLASTAQPSPRRLRSRDKQRTASGASIPSQPCSTSKQRKQASSRHDQDAKQEVKFSGVNGRGNMKVFPTRKAKVNSKEEETEVEEEDELLEDVDSEEMASQDGEVGDEEDEEDTTEKGSSEEEIDELASVTSSPIARRTPLKKRLRPRHKQGSAGPSDGDDEGDGGEAHPRRTDEVSGSRDDEAESVDLDDEDTDTASERADDEETIAVEPRKLRNGKIVGEEDVDMNVEEDIDEEGEDNEEEDEDIAEAEEDEIEDEDGRGEEDAEGETEEEAMDEEVDLAVATAKTLIRLRRNDLVRLCETRDLEPVGTKPQLAQALLQWRDRRVNEYSSPSSTGTVRPPSTARRRRYRTRNQSSEAQTPILSRSHRVHLDESRTPALEKEQEREKDKDKEGEQDLELDLESLGLEDREIPPDKLQKLEKIGSGGFKDVFIGKFKGRKIAIAEFRGQLSPMDIKELKLLGGFDHPNIVRFLGVSIPENTRETPVMIVSELCSNGDLFDYIRNVNAPSLHKILVMMLDIARGLEYLHLRKPSVIHRDCKSSNILITAKGAAKIADFGLAKVKQSTRSMVRSLVGTVNWQAPELWHAHPKYNHKVDVFSCAMVYWEMLQWHLQKANRKFPWEGMNEHAIYEIVGTKRQRPSVAGLRKQWCHEIVDLIEHMWMHDPQDRPTISEVVQVLEDLDSKY
ncbi:hypothetical protein AX15_001214 [Amanita polypyramis BW_CC]|nr:hypothetical protein AX15_001214 [Amanita polypyramis BW_CC]